MLSESSSSTYLQAQVNLQVLRNYAPAVMMAEDKQEQQLSLTESFRQILVMCMSHTHTHTQVRTQNPTQPLM